MKLINERTGVETVAERWRTQYPDRSKTLWRSERTVGQVADDLAALNVETATAADVAAIIGNGSWAGCGKCRECCKEADALVQLGEEPDYESSTAEICRECLQKALALIDGNN